MSDDDPRIKTRGGVSFILLQTRIRRSLEPELFDFYLGLNLGTAAGFFRGVLNDAFRAGAVTHKGFSMRADDALRSMQVQLNIATEDNRRLADDLLKAQQANAELASKLRNEPPASPVAPAPTATERVTEASPPGAPRLPSAFAQNLRNSQS